MKHTGISEKRRRLLLVLLMMLLLQPAELFAEAPTGGGRYIVKYRDAGADLMQEEGIPFDVVEEDQLARLLRMDALEWYEEDGEAVLFDVEEENGDRTVFQNLGADPDGMVARMAASKNREINIGETASPGEAETEAGKKAMLVTRETDSGEAPASQAARMRFGTAAASSAEEENDGSPDFDPDAQWNLALIHADVAFRKNCLGQGIRVGVLDSGVSRHPDFGERLLAGHNYMDDAPDPEETGDKFGHGTRVAGLIAAVASDGCIGAAPAAEIVPLKCTDGKSVRISAICRAIYGGIDDYDCDVLNLSLGVQTEYQSLKEAVAYAAEQGVVMTAAVGNGGSSTLYYPARYDSVIGVGCVDQNGVQYERSNHNSSVFLTAPGVDLRSTSGAGDYDTGTGTSFAVPQVSAAAAVLLGMDSTLTPGEIMDLLARTATDRGVPGYDEYYGYGILNLGDSTELLSRKQSDPEEPDYGQCPKDAGCILAAFADLEPTAWYHDGLHYVLENGIMNGYDRDRFGAGDSTTRAMIVTMLWRLEQSPESEEPLTFRDVPEHLWYTEAVRWCASKKLVAGYRETAFGPADAVSREQMATILWRYAGYDGIPADRSGGNPVAPDPLADFTDADRVSGWARDAMRWCIQNGLIRGMEEGILCPEGHADRAQTATLLMRYHALKKQLSTEEI